MELQTTPLIGEHKALGAQMGPFGGWLMPIQYSGILTEHTWCRTNACIFDICHMGEFLLQGDPLKTDLNRIVTMDVASIPVGGCRYGFILNELGGIIDDLVVYRLKDQEWMIVVNAAAIAADEAHFLAHLAPGTLFTNVSSRTGKLDLQGPHSYEILSRLVGSGLKELRYYQARYFALAGERLIISRTGYTGELGYEIYVEAQAVNDVWKTILKYPGVKPGGLGCRDTLRLEMGYPLYGQDISLDTTPLEAGLAKFVDFSKDFIGREALMRQKQNGGWRNFIAFKSDSRRAPRHNHRIYKGDKPIGVVTSGSFSPSLGCGIGMGYVDEPVSPGEAVSARARDMVIDAVVVDRPFFKGGTARLGLGEGR